MRSFRGIVMTMVLLAGVARADMILSSEDFEGEAAVFVLQTTSGNNTDYKLPGTFQHNNSWVQGHTASVNGAAEGNDPTGQHILTRSSTGTFVLTNPLPLSSGGFDSLRIDYAVNIRYSTDATALFLDYSQSNGAVNDWQTVLTLGSTANGSGTKHEEDRWYAGQSVTLDPMTYNFTDNANIRWRSGGFANSTRILLDDIVITGVSAIPEPSSMALLVMGAIFLRYRQRFCK